MSAPFLRFVFCAGLALAAVGCAPEIGDDCGTALDCSAQGSRLCDRTQPGGYCTIAGCERGTCPGEAVCVKFRPDLERLAVTYCMYKCSDHTDCRSGYVCTTASDFGSVGDAEILGSDKQRFCSIPESMPVPISNASDAASQSDAANQSDAATKK